MKDSKVVNIFYSSNRLRSAHLASLTFTTFRWGVARLGGFVKGEGVGVFVFVFGFGFGFWVGVFSCLVFIGFLCLVWFLCLGSCGGVNVLLLLYRGKSCKFDFVGEVVEVSFYCCLL